MRYILRTQVLVYIPMSLTSSDCSPISLARSVCMSCSPTISLVDGIRKPITLVCTMDFQNAKTRMVCRYTYIIYRSSSISSTCSCSLSLALFFIMACAWPGVAAWSAGLRVSSSSTPTAIDGRSYVLNMLSPFYMAQCLYSTLEYSE